MNSSDLGRYRQKLLQLQQELKDEHAQEDTQTVELDQSRMGRLSRMDALQNQQMALEAKRRSMRRLTAVEAALRNIDSGEFGYCVTCGEDIPSARLDFDPATTQCVACASEREPR